MSLILGILASSGGAAIAGSSYESIATVTLGSAQSTIDFNSIPSTFKHLQIRFLTKTSGSGSVGIMAWRFNGDSGNNYAVHGISGNGSSVGTEVSNSRSDIYIYGGYSDFGAGVIDILDYNSTTKTKTVRTLNGFDMNGSGRIELFSGLWLNSSGGITSISFRDFYGGNFAQYSSFALYGIKG